jgi:hypothetical protein
MNERLLDTQLSPTKEDLADYCGNSKNLFLLFNSFLLDLGTVEEIRFPYGKSYGWSVAHRKAGRLACDVFAEKGSFCVMARMKNSQFDAAYSELGPNAKACVDGRYACGDGGWIHFRVDNQEALNDIETLLRHKLAK